MREIKFRAWDETNKVMVYNVNINNGKPVKPGYQWFNAENTILHSEPQQYTGLKDKNGKEIYEGDIVRYTKHIYADCSKTKLIKVEKPIIGEFYFAEGLWPGLRFGNGTGMLFLPGDLDSEIEFEVIGNVVDHPHLLKEGV